MVIVIISSGPNNFVISAFNWARLNLGLDMIFLRFVQGTDLYLYFAAIKIKLPARVNFALFESGFGA
jgi:hypothetical protein